MNHSNSVTTSSNNQIINDPTEKSDDQIIPTGKIISSSVMKAAPDNRWEEYGDD